MKTKFKTVSQNILMRFLEREITHIKVQFLVPKEHGYKVGRWYDDVACVSAHPTHDDKFTCVTYVGVRSLYGDTIKNEEELVSHLINMVL